MSLKILINNSYIELDAEDITVPLTFSVADMKQPDKRKTSSSKTIKLKGTQNNLNVLRNVYSLPIAELDTPLLFSFDPRTRIEAIYEENGIVIFDGLFQVLKAVRVGEVFEFECLLFSNIANVISTLGDLKLSDLDFSEYQHELGKQVIRNSFDTSVIRDGVAVPNFNTTTGIPFGFGYVYGWFDLGLEYTANTARNQRTNQMLLGVYFKEVLSKMMQHIEQPYTFTLDNTELWKRLTLFNEGGQIKQISDADKAQREVEITQDLPFTNVQGIESIVNGQKTINFIQFANLNLQATITDDLDQVETDGSITILNTGTYQFLFDGEISALITSTYASTQLTTSQIVLQLLINGSVVSWINNTNLPNPSIFQSFAYSTTIDLTLNSGDNVAVRLRVVGAGNVSGIGSLTLALSETSAMGMQMLSLDSEIEDGALIDVVRYLPNMKCADFYKSIMRMFNLYQQDQEDGILIIPAIDYYQGTNSNETEDWSDKLDYSQTIEIEPPNRIQGKNYVFKYKTENDYYHNLYLQEFGSNYGDFTYTVPNTWQVGENVMEVGFALAIPEPQDNSDVIMPAIFTLENNNLPKPYKGKAPRIHVYNGLRNSTSESRIYTSAGASPLTIVNAGGNAYPEFHHMLNPAAPTFEIAFQAPQRLYYTGGQITNANLFNTYWDRFIREITSADSKILTAYFKLSRMDIYNLNFRSLKNIDGVVYRLNLVNDYMGQELTTKCELIKVIEGQSRRIGLIPIGTNINVSGDTRAVIEIDGTTTSADLRVGQIGIDNRTNQMFMNTGHGLVEFEIKAKL